VGRSGRIWLALATVYVVWGSTYFGIKLGIDTLPPFLMMSLRFAVAGGLLYAWAIRRGGDRADRVTWRHWRSAAVIGGLLLVAGNGGLAWAEQRVDTGQAALIVACVPIWFAVLEWVLSGRRLAVSGLVGLVVGLAGVGFLVGPSGAVDVGGGVVIVLGTLGWAAGSLYAQRATLPSRPLVAAAMQMLAASALNGLVGVGTGELSDLQAPSPTSLLGVLYLVVVGSIVGYTAYQWLLGHAPSSLVSTYAYVNPVVAVALGVAFLGEAVTWQMLVAGGAILAAVVLIVQSKTTGARPARVERAPEPALEPAA
jgi:drug/metabolite transporter (DMT)-like permease